MAGLPPPAPRRRGSLIAFALIVLLALAWRCPRLGQRPLHNDEAVNGIKFGQLWDARLARLYGPFQYDPREHHGPALVYATAALAWLTRAPDLNQVSEARLRLVAVLSGVGLLLLLPLIADGLGRRAALWAALLTALSPAMVFYSRYYIHEMLLVFFSFLALAAGWRYSRSRRLGWALLAGLALGLMHSTKETFILALAAAVLALGLNLAWHRWVEARGPAPKTPPLRLGHLAAAGVVWAMVAALLFSSFLANGHGLWDSVRTYGAWLGRAGGGDSPHVYRWPFYFHRLLWFHLPRGPVWSEGFILLLALLGAGAAFARPRPDHAHAGFLRFLALYTFALTAAYCLIPYKTPWCLLGFWHGAILLAGAGAAALIQSFRRRAWRAAATALCLAGAAHLGWQAWRANDGPGADADHFLAVAFERLFGGHADEAYAADPRNPYVFAHTSPDLLRLVERVEALAAVHPRGALMPLKIMAPDNDYWPLPWYLRRFEQAAWSNARPPDPYAPVMIVSAGLRANLEAQPTCILAGYYQLRPQVFLQLYVQSDLWRAYLEQHRK